MVNPEREPIEEDIEISLTEKQRLALRELVEGWWWDKSEKGEEMKDELLKKLA